MRRIGDDLLLDALRQREDYIQEAANAIDVKASQVIAGAAFLAVQPAVLLLSPNLPRTALVVQFVSCVTICAAVYFSHSALRIFAYPSPGFPEDWCLDVAAEFPDADDETVKLAMLWALTKQAQDRVVTGISINDGRLRTLKRARICIAISLACNLVSLIWTVARHYV